MTCERPASTPASSLGCTRLRAGRHPGDLRYHRGSSGSSGRAGARRTTISTFSR
jgi:hypothetical protein